MTFSRTGLARVDGANQKGRAFGAQLEGTRTKCKEVAVGNTVVQEITTHSKNCNDRLKRTAVFQLTGRITSATTPPIESVSMYA